MIVVENCTSIVTLLAQVCAIEIVQCTVYQLIAVAMANNINSDDVSDNKNNSNRQN